MLSIFPVQQAVAYVYLFMFIYLFILTEKDDISLMKHVSEKKMKCLSIYIFSFSHLFWMRNPCFLLSVSDGSNKVTIKAPTLSVLKEPSNDLFSL